MKNIFLLFFLIPLVVIAQQKLILENLGNTVNSKYDEVNPVISPDGKTLYFSRKDHPENNSGQTESSDIWYSVKDKQGMWTNARKMPQPFNQSRFNAIFGISPDGNTVIIKGAYEDGKYKGVGLSVVEKKKKGWSKPVSMNIESYQKMSRGIYDGAFLCSDNKTLLINLSEKRNDPTCDLYVSVRNEDETWTKPLNLGKVINSKETEVCPFLAADGVTLYFSSTRSDGFGDADIYKSTRLDDTWTNWSEPENLGPSVNTENRETYYSFPAAADYAFLVMNPGKFGKSDIVKLKLEKTSKPEPVVLIKGRVLDKKTNKPIESTITYENLTTGKELGVARSNPETGEYQIVVPKGAMVGFMAKSEGYWVASDNLDLTDLSEYKELTKDLLLTFKEIIETVTLNNIFFETGSAILKPESRTELEEFRKILVSNPGIKVEILGHTDNTGIPGENLILSENRAKAVKEYLETNGISSDRIIAKGYGQTKPVADNSTEEGKAQNRRVEFQILDK